MKDIARELGLSAATVSKIIRSHSDIGDATWQRVRKGIQKLNYQPNMASRILATGRSYSAGLIVPDLMHPFFGEGASGLALRRKIASTQWTVESFRRIEEREVPNVIVDRAFMGMPANFVSEDEHRSRPPGARAPDIGRLPQNGVHSRRRHQHGGGVTGRISPGPGAPPSEPVPGLRAGRTLGHVDSWIGGNEAMKKLLAQAPQPDGVFCYNDPIAIGAIDAILESGLRVPGDIAVIGCGNLHFDKTLRVPLSSVDQQSRAIEAKVAPQPKSVMRQPSIVARESTRRLP